MAPNVMTHVNNEGDEQTPFKFFEFAKTGADTAGVNNDNYGYDFTIDPCENIMVATSWGPPSSFDAGFNPALPYGRAIRVYKLPNEQSEVTRAPGVSEANLIVSFTLDPIKEMGGPATGSPAGLVALEVRRSHVPARQYYFVSVTLPGSIVLVYCDLTTTGSCDAQNAWKQTAVIPPAKLAADVVNTVHITNQGGNIPTWTNPFGAGDFKVPLVTDITLSDDDQFLYVSCWLAGVLLQYNVTDFKNPILVGGVAGLGGVTTIAPFTNVFNPNAYEFATGRKWAGGPQMLRLDQSGENLYLTNSLFSSWDIEFFHTSGTGSIETNGGMLIKLKTGVKNGRISATQPMSIDRTFGTNGVISFTGLRHPEVTGPFNARAHENHIWGVTH
jgi:hypothetical protein